MGNPNKTVYDIFLNTLKNKHNEKIYLQVQILFNLRKKSLKNCLIRKKYEESIAEKSEKKIWLISSKLGKVSEERFNLIKQIINENNNLGTTIDNKRYTLKYANDLVNKIAVKKIGKNKAIDF